MNIISWVTFSRTVTWQDILCDSKWKSDFPKREDTVHWTHGDYKHIYLHSLQWTALCDIIYHVALILITSIARTVLYHVLNRHSFRANICKAATIYWNIIYLLTPLSQYIMVKMPSISLLLCEQLLLFILLILPWVLSLTVTWSVTYSCSPARNWAHTFESSMAFDMSEGTNNASRDDRCSLLQREWNW